MRICKQANYEGWPEKWYLRHPQTLRTFLAFHVRGCNKPELTLTQDANAQTSTVTTKIQNLTKRNCTNSHQPTCGCPERPKGRHIWYSTITLWGSSWPEVNWILNTMHWICCVSAWLDGQLVPLQKHHGWNRSTIWIFIEPQGDGRPCRRPIDEPWWIAASLSIHTLKKLLGGGRRY